MKKSLISKIFGKKQVWEYGKLHERIARRHLKNKNVQFILWKKGEQNHQEDFWCNFDSYWWHEFEPYKD